MSPETAPQFYLMRGDEYLHWTGAVFTHDEEGAWLGSIEHIDAFRDHHVLASGRGVRAVRCVEALASQHAGENV